MYVIGALLFSSRVSVERIGSSHGNLFLVVVSPRAMASFRGQIRLLSSLGNGG